MWVYVAGGDGPPLRIFEFTRDRCEKRPREFLGNYRGYIHADAYKGYDDLFTREGVFECACWRHIRRKFFEAKDAPPDLRRFFLDAIRKLYQWEHLSARFKITRGCYSDKNSPRLAYNAAGKKDRKAERAWKEDSSAWLSLLSELVRSASQTPRREKRQYGKELGRSARPNPAAEPRVLNEDIFSL
jgi:hypothetical protein